MTSTQDRDWKSEVENCEDARDLYDLGLEMAKEIAKLRDELANALRWPSCR